jgi:membrane-associated phospholipid phosphatase
MAETARVFAALNVAMTDAFAAAWHAKFKWWTERPITVIREKLDPNFLSHVITPAFPGYVSGHATVSGAASAVLSGFFPDRADELQAMAEEAAMSRLYAGIHFRNDNEAGLELGRRVGARVTSKVLAAR